MRHAAILILAALTVWPACEDAPKHPDAALYRQAYQLMVAGKEAEARPLYHQIINGDAYSPYQADARVALAEMLFKEGDMDKALSLYRSVEAYPTATTVPYALYKQGWCLLNKGQNVEAIQAFERVVALPAGGAIPEHRRTELISAARKDLVKAYARSGLPEKASEYFHEKGGDDAPLLLENLAELYGERNRHDWAGSVLRELIAAHVDSSRICAWQGNIVRAALASGSKKDQLAEIQRLGAVLARLETGKAAADTVADCRQRLKETSKELALIWHKSAQKNKDPELFQLVDPMYRQYLTRFGGEKDGYDMTFFHAEALWGLERWADASEEYRRVVQMNPAGPHAKAAAYGAMLAAKNALEAEEGRKIEKPATGPVGPPQPLTAGERRLVAAFELYIAHVPESAELAAVEYRRARLLYDRDHHAEAAPLFWRVVERHPDSELAIYAGNLYLDSLNLLHRRADVCDGARKLLVGPLAARDAEAQRQWRKLVGDCARLEARARGKSGGEPKAR
jgi:tetratricopeptide (TPR) repeat protein